MTFSGCSTQEGGVIVSIDKDVLTLPELHLRDGEIFEASCLQADRNFYSQVLTGGTSNNYPGCPGIGTASAEKLLADCSTEMEMWQQTLKAFERKAHGKPYVIQQARCARILRAGEYDLASSTPLLREPPVA